jgi:phosphatidylinositol 3-kinase
LTNLNNGEGVPLPANLDIILKGVRVEKTKVFTSATKPLLLPFYYRMIGEEENRPETFTMMFKTGDDMRQDALILQLFSIMDGVLKDVGLECNFTIYNLIAFTTNDGLL